MFTGIVEEIGIIQNIKKVDNGAVITVKASTVLDGVKLGDSISINGACQTVVSFDNSSFIVETAKETLNLTNLNELKSCEKVNLERAMAANSRFGGHIVSGHVEGMGSFLKKTTDGLATIFYFDAPKNIEKYMIYKGSICVNGISLTIASLEKNVFSISVIPQTIKETNLSELKVGDKVNLEPDVIAKYIEKFFVKNDNKKTGITLDYLQQNGFME